jgi:hypothetical protein
VNRIERGSRGAIAQERRWSFVLAIATAAAILLSGLNGLVQILKVLVESGILRVRL